MIKGGDIMGDDLVEIYRRKKNENVKLGRGHSEKIRQMIREILKHEKNGVLVSVMVHVLREMPEFEKYPYRQMRMKIVNAVEAKNSGLKIVKKDGRVYIVST